MRQSDIWLGVAGLVLKGDQVLAVKKAYSKTKGLWTFPGGFVSPGETIDEAVIREIKEETSIDVKVEGLIGARTGVLENRISDNLLLFLLTYMEGEPTPRIGEIEEAKFISIEELLLDENTNEFMLESLKTFKPLRNRLILQEIKPLRNYGYTTYKIFK